MKTKQKLKIGTLLIACLLYIFISTAPANALQTKGNEMLCQRDYITFISSVISYDGFSEYWKDIFSRYNKNICYYMDINSVQNQLEKVRTDIRNAFYACNSARAADLRIRYFELEAELFFLRNFVDISLSDIKTLPDNKVYELLRSNFVIGKSYFDEARSLELFEKFKNKYQQKVKTVYKDCKDPGLDALTKKFKSLIESFKKMGSPSVGQSIREEWNNSINAPVKRTGNFLDGFTDVRINGLTPQKAADKLYSDLVKDLQTTSKQRELELREQSSGVVGINTSISSGGGQPTLDQVQNTLLINEINYQQTVQTASLKAKYTALYKEGTDTMIKDFKIKLEELNKIISDTLQPLTNLKECAKKSAEKQCK